ncbi:strictosidine synthase [Aeromicrobium ginsengisoli]|uniref:Strictosidine synthase n=1 Tax=Aeromicrobium ginsengisoli TaxID=363867 RepID=A0A5M4F990_9ACTN|nr:strictosidine synthase [Aeromicrobium ginsengisoli]KAA1394322.1 strictosidine synthase [Aeromicrobium ginsengisoli]
MSTSTAAPKARKQLSSSILLWVRTDQPRQTGMDYWKGPHSGIISANRGLKEYRQIHVAEDNVGRWPATAGIATAIPHDRKIDGIAEVTLKGVLSTLQGRKQNAMAYQDEINVFRRTLLYAGLPGMSRWYDVAPGEPVGSRAVIYVRRRDGVSARTFRKLVNTQLVSAMAGTGLLKELRTQTFLPWSQKLWDTPNVAHDNPEDQRFHASVMLGFADDAARDAFFAGDAIRGLSEQLIPLAATIHAYDVTAALTYVKDARVLPHHEA